MSHFLASLHPDDVPPHCQGEPILEDAPEPELDDEGADDDDSSCGTE